MLGRLLQKTTEDVSSQDLHDRALLYYRLLSTTVDPKVVQEILGINSQIPGSSNFSEESCDDEFRKLLMEEFNSLSILYGTMSENFIAEEYQVKFVKMPVEHPLDGTTAPIESSAVNELANDMQQSSIQESAPPPITTPAPPPAAEVDLLGFGTDPTPAPTPAPIHSPATLTLDPSATLSGEEYQSKWGAVSDAEAHVICFSLSSLPPSTDAVEAPLDGVSVKIMASGELETELKFFLYGQESSPSNALYLVQATISKTMTPIEMFLTVKICGPGGREKAEQFVEVIKASLSSFIQ